MKYPLKLIEWHDAHSGNHSWFKADTLPEKPECYPVYTMGFEVLRDDKHVVLSMSYGSDNDMLCDLFTIPLGMIVREQTFRYRRTLADEGVK